jgi:hypothetical protein
VAFGHRLSAKATHDTDCTDASHTDHTDISLSAGEVQDDPGL